MIHPQVPKKPKAPKAELTQGSVTKILFYRSLPMLAGIMGVVFFNLADTFFIGMLGTTELAAISFTFPIVMTIGGLSMGLGTGAAAVISKAIGAGDYEQVKRLTTDSLFLSVSIVATIIIIGFITIDPLFRILGATEETLPLIRQYMTIWYPGMIFLVVPMVGNSAIRATGDMKTPGIIMIVAMLINVTLDPLLIFGIGPFPRLELQGAAIATVIARSITLAVALYVLYFRNHMITFVLPPLLVIWESWKKILYIGLPSGGTNVIVPVGVGILTRLVSTYGPAAVAAFGVASRIEMFVMTVFMALASVLGPFIGQNWGARLLDRVKQGVRFSYIFALIWGGIAMVLLGLLSYPIASLFSDNPQVVEITAAYLLIVPIGYGFHGIVMLSNITLNVLNRPFQAAVINITHIGILLVPGAFLASHFFGLNGVFWASTASKFLAGILGFLVLRLSLNIEQKKFT